MKTITTVKGTISDGLHTVWHLYGFKCFVHKKQKWLYFLYSGWQRDPSEVFIIGKSRNVFNAIVQDDAFQHLIVVKRTFVCFTYLVPFRLCGNLYLIQLVRHNGYEFCRLLLIVQYDAAHL